MEGRFYETPWGRLHAVVTGLEVLPMLLIHGNNPNNNWRIWEDNLPVWRQVGRVYALDLIGWGLSQEPAEPLSVAQHLQTLTWLMDQEGYAQAVLVGVSWGGGLCLRAALKEPERVGALVLFGCAPPLRMDGSPAATSAELEELAAIACPILLVWGEDDAIIPLEQGLRLAGFLPTASFHAIPDVTKRPGVPEWGGHHPQHWASEDVNPLVMDFLRELEA